MALGGTFKSAVMTPLVIVVSAVLGILVLEALAPTFFSSLGDFQTELSNQSGANGSLSGAPKDLVAGLDDVVILVGAIAFLIIGIVVVAKNL